MEISADKINSTISRISNSDDLIDMLIDLEDYLDGSDLYVFKNWINGEIVSGPYVSKYWIKIILKYPYHLMPDPSGAIRLNKTGTQIKYKIGYENVPIEIKDPSDYQPGTKKPRMVKAKIWLVTLLVPRRLIKKMSDEVMDLYDEDVDGDAIEANDIQSSNDSANGVKMPGAY